MSIELFSHNQQAYSSLCRMLANTGRAAVIHPTGTGKSFLAFKLAEDNPERTICWLSPSDYIFKTQLDNLKRAGGETPRNIRFFTYARLMLLSVGELEQLHPDYIVLDEFHRCGAEMWGRGVQTLLSMYAEVPLLGLSATNIRYLDNQRDMADELFDGNIASHITLGEAVVRGILRAPTYVTTLYSCEQEMDKLEQRVQRAKSSAARDEAQQYLDALRRALEQAKGLPEIFGRHMERRGKYLVFCANREHMEEMISLAGEWFAQVDPKPHIHRAYAEDPATQREFQQFSQDDSDHLKLLYCIDMFNEGVHVSGVDGVVLLRPTISPIIYKQQIGRALSAGGEKTPVIFDIVNNFENLYSISALQEEMEMAVSYYHFWGKDDQITAESFRVLDEVRECRRLFEQLEQTLSASWELMYRHAERYFKEYGNLDVPGRYKTPEGYSLGSWLTTQRRVRAGEVRGELSEDRIQKLDRIGMVWGSVRDAAWERGIQEARSYVSIHGSLNAKIKENTVSGFPIGRWLCRLRFYRKNGAQQRYLTPWRIQELDGLGMVWDMPDYLWQQNYMAAMDYYLTHGDLEVPAAYVTEDGLRLGSWIVRQRRLRAGKGKGKTLTREQVDLLDELHMRWGNQAQQQWEVGYLAAKEYVQANGNLDVPVGFVTEDGLKLGDWLRGHRDGTIRLTPDRRHRLDELGMVWSKDDPWEKRYELAEAYYREHGDLEPTQDYMTPDGIWLGKWVYLQRQRKEKLTGEQIRRLEAIGMNWLSPSEREWEKNFSAAKQYAETFGDLNVPSGYVDGSGLPVGRWLNTQRRHRTNARGRVLNAERIHRLDGIGMVWV